MIKVITVDNEQPCLKVLRNILKDCAEVELLAECETAEAARQAIEQHSPDLLFLDIEMPGKNGFDLLRELEGIDFSIVFTTAFDQYAILAIKAGALDFLLKPVAPEEVREALEKHKAKETASKIRQQVNIAIDYFSRVNNPDQKIVLPTINGLEFIRLNNIIRVSSDSNYCHIHLTNKTRFTVSRTLKEMEELLMHYHFIRIHHSHLVNLKYIKRYQKGDGGTLVMEDGSELGVSRTRKDEFMKGLKLFHG